MDRAFQRFLVAGVLLFVSACDATGGKADAIASDTVAPDTVAPDTVACTEDSETCVTSPTDVIQTIDPGPGEIVDHDTAEAGPDALPPPASRDDCKPCSGDLDCSESSRCLPVGSSKHCLMPCTDEGDCPASYVCHAASTADKACLPSAFNCWPCAYEAPCDSGQVCNLQDGLCQDGRPTCSPCQNDYDCQAGLRCLQGLGRPTGACVPECGDTGTCADSERFECRASARGVDLCTPRDPTGCDGCARWEQICPDDGQCHQCCTDGDCQVWFGSFGECRPDGTCAEGEDDPCQGLCSGLLSVCADHDGAFICYECSDSSDCAGRGSGSCVCSGSPSFACLEPDGSHCIIGMCAATCATDADCPDDPSVELRCSGPNGVCYNPGGACDDMACCPGGSACYDLMSMLTGLGVPGIPASSQGVCTCDAAHPCLGGRACVGTDVLCTTPGVGDVLCPGGAKPAGLPDSLCYDPELLQDLGGGI